MTEDDDRAIFDVYCEDADGVRFLVEMQNWSQHYFNKRAVYYSTYAIQDQAAREKKHQQKTLGKENFPELQHEKDARRPGKDKARRISVILQIHRH